MDGKHVEHHDFANSDDNIFCQKLRHCDVYENVPSNTKFKEEWIGGECRDVETCEESNLPAI